MSALRLVLRLTAVPFLLGTAALVAGSAIRQRWNLDVTLAGVAGVTVLYVLLVERLIPLYPDWRVTSADLPADGFHLLSISITSGIGAVAAFSSSLWLHEWIGFEWSIWSRIPLVGLIVLANVIGEVVPYWYHRWSHAANPGSGLSLFLWRVHAIHHLPAKLNS